MMMTLTFYTTQGVSFASDNGPNLEFPSTPVVITMAVLMALFLFLIVFDIVLDRFVDSRILTIVQAFLEKKKKEEIARIVILNKKKKIENYFDEKKDKLNRIRAALKIFGLVRCYFIDKRFLYPDRKQLVKGCRLCRGLLYGFLTLECASVIFYRNIGGEMVLLLITALIIWLIIPLVYYILCYLKKEILLLEGSDLLAYSTCYLKEIKDEFQIGMEGRIWP